MPKEKVETIKKEGLNTGTSKASGKRNLQRC